MYGHLLLYFECVQDRKSQVSFDHVISETQRNRAFLHAKQPHSELEFF